MRVVAPSGLLVVLLAACAGGGVPVHPDALEFLDAPGPDAAVPVNLLETADTAVSGGVVTCIDPNAGPTHNNTYDNTWWRAYQLSDFPEISGGLHISTVVVGVFSAKSAGTITLKIGSYTGAVGGTTIDLTKLDPLAMATFHPVDTQQSLSVSVPIDADIPPGGKFVVQVAAPSVQPVGFFYLGGTPSAETQPGYWSSTSCTTPSPKQLTTGGHVLFTIAGTR